MEVLKYILIVLELIVSVVLTILVLMQSSEESDLGAIAGNSGTYMNKDQGGIENFGQKYTKWIALAWGVLAFALVIVLKVIAGQGA